MTPPIQPARLPCLTPLPMLFPGRLTTQGSSSAFVTIHRLLEHVSLPLRISHAAPHAGDVLSSVWLCPVTNLFTRPLDS